MRTILHQCNHRFESYYDRIESQFQFHHSFKRYQFESYYDRIESSQLLSRNPRKMRFESYYDRIESCDLSLARYEQLKFESYSKPLTGSDDTGIMRVDVRWDSGSNLFLLYGIDEFDYL